MHITVWREIKHCTKEATPGKMYIDGHYFAYTLEDALRHPQVKIAGETCVPCCTVDVKVTKSSKFGRDMIILHNQSNGYEIQTQSHSWHGVRVHGANTVADLAGCIGVAVNRISYNRIQGSREADLTEIVKIALDGGDKVKLTWILV